ncbi:6492_t:CDS:2, partial [Acaulospora colombiana]
VTIGAVAKKVFRQPDGIEHVVRLNSLYTLLEEKKVPNTDELVDAILGPKYPYILTKPIGLDRSPRTGAELFQAVSCLLEALKVMHAEPDPVYHRDIRKPNILKRRDEEGWFLIDWSDASKAPTQAATHMTREEHSPRVFEDNHGGEVD